MNPAAPALPPGQAAVHRLAFVTHDGATLPAALAIARAEPTTGTSPWLAPGELRRLAHLQADTARADFLAGRIAAKAALAALAPPVDPAACELVSGAWGQPCLRGAAPGLAVTLAHAGGTGIALAHDDRWLAGIDLEWIAGADTQTIATTTGAAGRAWAASATSDADRHLRWLVLWSAREALGKLLRAGIARPGLLPEPIAIEETASGWRGCFAGAEDIGLHACDVGGFMVCLVTPAVSANDAAILGALRWLRGQVLL